MSKRFPSIFALTATILSTGVTAAELDRGDITIRATIDLPFSCILSPTSLDLGSLKINGDKLEGMNMRDIDVEVECQNIPKNTAITSFAPINHGGGSMSPDMSTTSYFMKHNVPIGSRTFEFLTYTTHVFALNGGMAQKRFTSAQSHASFALPARIALSSQYKLTEIIAEMNSKGITSVPLEFIIPIEIKAESF